MVRIPGIFRNFDELEENLTLAELELLLSKAREVEHDRQRFAASLKGINLDSQNKESQEEAYERVKRRAKARLTGMSEEEVELS
jgi:hypothetical protein